MAHAAWERYFNRPLPKCIAKCIARVNNRQLSKCDYQRITVKSYEGSDQVVHPDFLHWNDKIWMVCTPYPYGYNRCENPSVYVGNDVFSLIPACKNPIDLPSSKSRGSILSDPCFFTRNNKLFICYRERIQNKEYVEYILHTQCSVDGTKWTDKKAIKSTVTADKDPLISPAVIQYNDKYYLYHVRAKGLGGDIVLSSLVEDREAEEIKVLNCSGLPEGFVIWHIGLHSDSYSKFASDGNEILGLFTVRNGVESRVYKAHQDNPTGDWIIDEQIDIPDTVRKDCREVYKCSYTPDGRVALSFFDKKNRLVITVV